MLSHVFAYFGHSPEWFLDPDLALLMVIIVYIWKNLGYCAVIFLAGCSPFQHLFEAAAIDRAGAVVPGHPATAQSHHVLHSDHQHPVIHASLRRAAS